MRRRVILVATPLLSAFIFWQTSMGQHISVNFLDFQLQLYRLDELSRLFGILFHLAAFISFIFAWHLNDRIQQFSGIIYAGSALGAVMAGDWLTLFVFWELLACSSVFLIWARRTERANSAGIRLLIIQILSGILLLAGALIYYQSTGQHQYT